MLHIPASDVLEPAINGPFAYRPLVLLLYHIDKACFSDHVLNEWGYQDVLAKPLACFGRKIIATVEYVARRDGTVVRRYLWERFALLNVAAWGDVATRRQI